MAISVVSFSFSRAAQPEAWRPSLLNADFLYRILSPTGLQTHWLPVFTELYNSSIAHSISPHNWPLGMCHFRCPWNGMFDCLQVEITVMQFTGHSLPVHQSMTVPRDFTLSHIVSQARLRQWNMQLLCLWNVMSGRVEGQYTTQCLTGHTRGISWQRATKESFQELLEKMFFLPVTWTITDGPSFAKNRDVLGFTNNHVDAGLLSRTKYPGRGTSNLCYQTLTRHSPMASSIVPDCPVRPNHPRMYLKLIWTTCFKS